MREYVLLPAYGRKYKSVADTVADWEAGKDFKIYGRGYCSIRDFEAMKKDVDRIVFIVHCSQTDKIMRFNYWIDPLSAIFPTTYI